MDPNAPRSWKQDFLFLLPCIVVGLVVRLVFFSGVSLHDDISYWMQSISTGLANAWPPPAMHWNTRIGFILPCALLLKILGLKVWVPYVFTMAGGLLEVALAYFITRWFLSEKVARVAAWLTVFFPLSILYSGYLFVDLWAGVLGALSLFYWIRALDSDNRNHYLLASVFLGLAWLVRETIVMVWPVYVAIWLRAGRLRRPRAIWALVPALLIVAAECGLYQLTAGKWYYRFFAIMRQQSDASNLELISSSSAGGGFILDPILQLITSHELGLFMAAALVLSLWGWRDKTTRTLSLWLLVGFVWLSWGTTVPNQWVLLQRDPRYLSVLTIPCVALLAFFLLRVQRTWLRSVFLAALIGTGMLGVSLDSGRTRLAACRNFDASQYNSPEAVLEPFVYFGARAASNFSTDKAHYACASDLGRYLTLAQMNNMPGARLEPVADAKYLVLSATVQPEKWQTKIKEGWKIVAEIPGESSLARKMLGRALALVPSQEKRAAAVQKTEALLVLENPKFTKP